jgi:predicted GNAT family acetyltransferase
MVRMSTPASAKGESVVSEEVTVVDVNEENLAWVEAFLRKHSETALFLLSNLADNGFSLGDDMSSGNYKSLQSGGEICGVFCLTRRGNLLAETGGRADLAGTILDACADDGVALSGVVGEWRLAHALWQRAKRTLRLSETYRSRDILYRLGLTETPPEVSEALNLRLLTPEDFEIWAPVSAAFAEEQGLPLQGTLDQRRKRFESTARERRWWGCFEDDALIATVALNALYERFGQVGGVYTIPSRRRKGLARALMHRLIADCATLHRLDKLILFTEPKNRPARRLYESLGFVQIGAFGLLFGA